MFAGRDEATDITTSKNIINDINKITLKEQAKSRLKIWKIDQRASLHVQHHSSRMTSYMSVTESCVMQVQLHVPLSHCQPAQTL